MSIIAIKEQLTTIKKASEKAVKSKETALSFLKAAGLITETKPHQPNKISHTIR